MEGGEAGDRKHAVLKVVTGVAQNGRRSCPGVHQKCPEFFLFCRVELPINILFISVLYPVSLRKITSGVA